MIERRGTGKGKGRGGGGKLMTDLGHPAAQIEVWRGRAILADFLCETKENITAIRDMA